MVVLSLADRVVAVAYVRAALKQRVAIIELDEAPAPDRDLAIDVHAPGAPEPLRLAATLAGEALGRMYPMRVRPRDDFAEGALIAYLAAEGALSMSMRPSPASAPRSSPPSLRLGRPSGPPLPREESDGAPRSPRRAVVPTSSGPSPPPPPAAPAPIATIADALRALGSAHEADDAAAEEILRRVPASFHDATGPPGIGESASRATPPRTG